MKKRKTSPTDSRRSHSERATSRRESLVRDPEIGQLLAGLNRDASARAEGDPLLDEHAAAIFRALASAMNVDCERAGTLADGRPHVAAMMRAHLRRLAFTAGLYRTNSFRR
jgi:hypothetical protein